MPKPSPTRFTLLAGATTCALVAGFSFSAVAHEAKSGWMYPPDCCSNRDCRELPGEFVTEQKQGYAIKLNGEHLAYFDSRIRPSPDGVYHWCSAYGRDDTRTICLFVPPNSF